MSKKVTKISELRRRADESLVKKGYTKAKPVSISKKRKTSGISIINQFPEIFKDLSINEDGAKVFNDVKLVVKPIGTESGIRYVSMYVNYIDDLGYVLWSVCYHIHYRCNSSNDILSIDEEIVVEKEENTGGLHFSSIRKDDYPRLTNDQVSTIFILNPHTVDNDLSSYIKCH